jgi:putative oxidoreductase
MFKRLLATESNYAQLFARLALGIAIFPHGAQKLLGIWGGHGPADVIANFQKWFGIPSWLTVLVIAAEFFGGLMLIFGFAGRFAAFGIACVMAGAIALLHGRVGFFMNWYGNQRGEGFEYHILAIGLALAIMIKGSGALSIDRRASKKR